MKDAFYFPHFSNARTDRKIKRLIKALGIEGYGIYFMLLEVLREQTEFRYPISDIDLLADEFGTSVPKVEAVIKAFGLFEVDNEEMFFSLNLIKYLEPMFKMKEQRSVAGKASAEARRQKLIEAEQPFNDRSTTDERVFNEIEQKKREENKLNKKKVNESDEKRARENSYTYPLSDTDTELTEFFTNNGSTPEDAKRFYNHYASQGWVKPNGQPIAMWQAAAKSWIDKTLHDPKFKPTQTESDYTKYQKQYNW
jgi:uncharacterized protein YdaU (DUF1376 family)